MQHLLTGEAALVVVVEVGHLGEQLAGQEGGLPIAVGPFHQPL